MVEWTWLLVAFFLGELMALLAIAVFVGGGDR